MRSIVDGEWRTDRLKTKRPLGLRPRAVPQRKPGNSGDTTLGRKSPITDLTPFVTSPVADHHRVAVVQRQRRHQRRVRLRSPRARRVVQSLSVQHARCSDDGLFHRRSADRGIDVGQGGARDRAAHGGQRAARRRRARRGIVHRRVASRHTDQGAAHHATAGRTRRRPHCSRPSGNHLCGFGADRGGHAGEGGAPAAASQRDRVGEGEGSYFTPFRRSTMCALFSGVTFGVIVASV